MHMVEASKLVPTQIELRGIFLLSLKGAESGQKAAKMLFRVGVPAAICCLYMCSYLKGKGHVYAGKHWTLHQRRDSSQKHNFF